jgi:hypothetical protein
MHSAFTRIVAERGKGFRRRQIWRFWQESGTGGPFVFAQVKPQQGYDRLGPCAGDQVDAPI